MTQKVFTTVVLVGLAGLFTACESSRSSNPLSPTVAGPIPGVVISAPKLVTPAAGQRIAATDQPVTLTVENATTNGVRPVTYVFEIAADAGFTNKVYSRQGVEPGSSGKTSVTLTDSLATGRTYYWRAQAVDGANSGVVPSAVNFDIYTPVVIQAPVLVSPVNGTKITVTRPALTLTNPTRTGPAGSITYNFQVSETQSFSAIVINAVVPEGSGQTTYTATDGLSYSKTYYWRVRASDPTTTGPWSVTQSFVTPDQPTTPTPTPTPGRAPGDQLTVGTAVIVKGPSAFASWPAASTVTSVTTSGGSLCIYHTMLGVWPSTAFFGAIRARRSKGTSGCSPTSADVGTAAPATGTARDRRARARRRTASGRTRSTTRARNRCTRGSHGPASWSASARAPRRGPGRTCRRSISGRTSSSWPGRTDKPQAALAVLLPWRSRTRPYTRTAMLTASPTITATEAPFGP